MKYNETGFPGGSAAKYPPANAGDAGDASLIFGLGRSPGERNGNPLQHSCWETSWTEKPGGLQTLGLQRVGHNLATKTIAITCKIRKFKLQFSI